MKFTITKRAIIIISLMMLTSMAWAQRNQGPPPQPNRQQIVQMVNELSTELKLSDTQAAQVSTLYENHFNEMKATMSQNSGGKHPDREAMESFRQAFENQVKTLLTPEQEKAYDKFIRSHAPQSRPQAKRR